MKALVIVASLAALLVLGGLASAQGSSGPTITSPTHPAGVAVNASVAHFEWTGSSGPYLYLLSTAATAEPTEIDNATDQASADVLVPVFGQWYLHVVAISGTTRSEVGHYGPVMRNSGLSEVCASAIQGGDQQSANKPGFETCIAAAQKEFAPEAILGIFMLVLAKFGSATFRRG